MWKNPYHHLCNLLLHFFQDGARAIIGKKATSVLFKKRIKWFFCVYMKWETTEFLQTFQRNICQLQVPFRFWSFGGFHGNYFLFSYKVNLLLPSLSRPWIIPLSAEMIVCVQKDVKTRNEPILRWFLGLPCSDVSFYCNSKWNSHVGSENESGGSQNTFSLCFSQHLLHLKNKPQKISWIKVF